MLTCNSRLNGTKSESFNMKHHIDVVQNTMSAVVDTLNRIIPASLLLFQISFYIPVYLFLSNNNHLYCLGSALSDFICAKHH